MHITLSVQYASIMSVNTASSTRDTVKVIIQLEQVMPHVIELFSTLIEQRDKAGWWQS
jgi:hypothetical protein